MWGGVVEVDDLGAGYGELAGRRVLIAGISPTLGVDITRGFAEQGCRLILQIPRPCPETDALLQIVAESAMDVRVHHAPLDTPDAAISFAQGAAQAFGGLDVAINIISLSRADLAGRECLGAVEEIISQRFQATLHGTRVAANRMRLTMQEGLVLNVLRMPRPLSPADAAFNGIARSVLAALTRREAEAWSDQSIRINAVATRASLGDRREADTLRGDADIAALALRLAAERGKAMSGMVFDADGIA